jgi:hypothetical protein
LTSETEPEKISENILEILEDRPVESFETRFAEPVRTEPVVGFPFLGIAQDAVGFGRLLEAILGRPVSGIAVGMVFQSQLTIFFFDLLGAGRSRDAENFVIIEL